MAWRVLAAKGLVSPGESLVGAPVRAVHPLVAFVLIGGGAAIALVARRLADRRKVDAFAAGISGAGVGAALVFLRTHGMGGLPTLALAAAAAGFMARRAGGSTGSGGRSREIAPKARRRPAPKPAAAPPRLATVADLAFSRSPKFVSPPRLEHGQVSHYAPSKTPVSRYIAPDTGAMTPGGSVSPRSPERSAVPPPTVPANPVSDRDTRLSDVM